MLSIENFKNAISSEPKKLVNGLIAGVVAYIGADSILKGRTCYEIHDMIDDIVTAEIATPVSEMISANSKTSGALGRIVGVAGISHLRIGNKVADYICPVPTTTDGGLDTEAVPTPAVMSATKVVLGAITAIVSIVDFEALTGGI